MRQEKNLLIEEVRTKINGSPYVLVTDYTGMNFPQFCELRNRLRPSGARFSVVKNTMLRNALRQMGWPDMADVLAGQTAIITGSQDICSATKIVKSFTAEFTKPTLRGGVLDGSQLTADQVIALADLPTKDVLQAQLLGVLLAPATKLVRLLNTPGSQLAQVLQAYVDKEQKGEAAPAA